MPEHRHPVAASGTFSTPDRYSTCPARPSMLRAWYGFSAGKTNFPTENPMEPMVRV